MDDAGAVCPHDLGRPLCHHDDVLVAPDVEIAVVDWSSATATGLLSVVRIGHSFVARIVYRESQRLDGWFKAWTSAGPIGLAGGGSGSFDGDVWTGNFRLGQFGQKLPATLAELHVAIDDAEVTIQPASLANLRELTLNPGGLSRELLALGCPGCGRPGDRRHCGPCGAAIDAASRQASRSTWRPDRVVPLGVTLGDVDEATVSLIDLEVYGGSSILRSWWAIEADEDQPLSELRSPLNRRLHISTDAGDDVVAAPGSSWGTDGHGVITDHRIPARLDPAARTLRIHTSYERTLVATIDLPDLRPDALPGDGPPAQ